MKRSPVTVGWILVVAIAATTAGCTDGSATPSSSRAAPPSTSGKPGATAPSEATAAIRLVQADDSWKTAATAPVPALSEAGLTPSLNGLEQVTRFWVAPGSVEATAAWVEAHPPPGYRKSTDATSGGPHRDPVRSIQFDRINDPTGSSHADLVIALVADGTGNGTAIRADAQVSSSTIHF